MISSGYPVATTSDLSNYALSSHTHSEYAPSSHTHSNYVSFGSYPTLQGVKLSNPGTSTSSSANVRMITESGASQGKILYTKNGSLRKLKHDIKPIEEGNEEISAERLYDIEVVSFKYNNDYLDNKEDSRYNRDLCGFIVDDLEIVYPVMVDYEGGKPTTWNPRYIIPPMLKLIQEQKRMIDDLEARVKLLEHEEN